jgi:FtsZ-interacting cell division protein ZipA
VLLFLFGKGEWRNRNEKSVEIRNEEIGKIEERRNQGQYRIILSADTTSEVRQLLSQKRR